MIAELSFHSFGNCQLPSCSWLLVMNGLKYPHSLWHFPPDCYSASEAPGLDLAWMMRSEWLAACWFWDMAVSEAGIAGFSPWREESCDDLSRARLTCVLRAGAGAPSGAR